MTGTLGSCSLRDYDVAIVAGNNYPPIEWQFFQSENPDVLLPLDGMIFKMTISWPGGTIVHSSDAALGGLEVPHSDLTYLDDGTGYMIFLGSIEIVADSILRWNYSTEESRMLPLGRIAIYEIESWLDDKQQSHVAGFIAVSGGLNPD